MDVSPARLGLARVSVVRGAGERAGEPCIDDYIQAVEPVHDYLTKRSGLVCAPVWRTLTQIYLGCCCEVHDYLTKWSGLVRAPVA